MRLEIGRICRNHHPPHAHTPKRGYMRRLSVVSGWVSTTSLDWCMRRSSSSSSRNAASALELLRAPNECDDKSLKECYREQVLVHHPDQGGDAKKLMALTEAYKYLADMDKSMRTRDEPPIIPENDPLNEAMNFERDVTFGASRANNTSQEPSKRSVFRKPAAPFWELRPEEVGQDRFWSGSAAAGARQRSAAEFCMNNAEALDEVLRHSDRMEQSFVSNRPSRMLYFLSLGTIFAIVTTAVLLCDTLLKNKARMRMM